MRLRAVQDQVMVITGRRSGIGLVTARWAARVGAAVILAARTREAVETLAEEIRRDGGRALPRPHGRRARG